MTSCEDFFLDGQLVGTMSDFHPKQTFAKALSYMRLVVLNAFNKVHDPPESHCYLRR
jgi:hypothetical protein